MRQKWGQNFLNDEAIAREIVDGLPGHFPRILEIGPGRGALTQHLFGRAPEIVLVELDRHLAETLGRRWVAKGFQIVNADFLDWPLPDWPARSIGLIGNLPYSAGNAIVRKFLDWDAWQCAVVMLQKEVANRMVARPDTPDYGLLSLAVQGKAEVEILFDVAPGAFKPPPAVTSSVLRLKPLSESLIHNEKRFFEIARAAFSQRRKMLLNNLSHGLALEKSDVIATLSKHGIDPQRRPQTLTFEEFNLLAAIL